MKHADLPLDQPNTCPILVGSRVRLPENAGWLTIHVRGQLGTVIKMIEPAEEYGNLWLVRMDSEFVPEQRALGQDLQLLDNI